MKNWLLKESILILNYMTCISKLLQEYYDHFGTTERTSSFYRSESLIMLKSLAKWISSQDQDAIKCFWKWLKIDFEEVYSKNSNQEKEEYKLI